MAPYDALRDLREKGSDLWRGVDPDGYVRELRGGWAPAKSEGLRPQDLEDADNPDRGRLDRRAR